MTVQRRTRGLSLAVTGSPQSMRRRINAGLRDLDRSKVITKPSVFSDSSKLPDARKNGGRIVFVKQANGSYQGQYSDGLTWNSFLASAVSFDTPAITYGSAAAAGSSSKTIRTNSQLRFPQALKSLTGAFAELTYSDGGANDGHLNSSVDFQIEAPTTVTLTPGAAFINFQDLGISDVGTSDIQLDGDTGFWNIISGSGFLFSVTTFGAISTARGTGDSVVGILIDHSFTNERYGLDCLVTDNSPTLASKKVGIWNATMGALSGVWTGSSEFVAYDTTSFVLSPSGGSGTALKAYGARILEPAISSTSGGWTEVAGLYVKSYGAATGTTITKSAGGIVEMPRQSTTLQVGLDLINLAAGDTPTDRIGIRIPTMGRGTNRYGLQIKADSTGTPTLNIGLDIEARTVGTTRYSIRTVTDPEYFGGHVQMDDSVKHKLGTAQDAEVYYDGTDLIIDPDVVGTGSMKVQGKTALTDDVTISDAKNIILNTSNGTKIGTATNQKLGFWNAAPVAQGSSTGETVGFTAGGGTNVTDASTFTGNVGATAYRISDIVKHLKNAGIIAT